MFPCKLGSKKHPVGCACQTGQIPVSGSYCYLAYDWTVLDIWKGKEIQKILGIQKRPKMRIPGSCDVTKEFLGD